MSVSVGSRAAPIALWRDASDRNRGVTAAILRKSLHWLSAVRRDEWSGGRGGVGGLVGSGLVGRNSSRPSPTPLAGLWDDWRVTEPNPSFRQFKDDYVHEDIVDGDPA